MWCRFLSDVGKSRSFFSHFSPTCIILYYICNHYMEVIMLNHCKSLIFSNLQRGGVKSRYSAEENDRKVVSVTPYYSIHSNKAFTTGPSGSVESAVLYAAALRHCEGGTTEAIQGTSFISGLLRSSQ